MPIAVIGNSKNVQSFFFFLSQLITARDHLNLKALLDQTKRIERFNYVHCLVYLSQCMCVQTGKSIHRHAGKYEQSNGHKEIIQCVLLHPPCIVVVVETGMITLWVAQSVSFVGQGRMHPEDVSFGKKIWCSYSVFQTT